MLPPPNEDTRVAELTRRVENLESALRAAFTTIAGGGITVTGGGITLIGGRLWMKGADGTSSFYVGPVNPPLPDGSYQPGLILRRNDGTIALQLYDPIPSEGDYNQFLAWRDRQGNIVLSDDTDSGQGLARPYVPFVFYDARNGDWPVVTSGAFTTVYRAKGPKQQPKLYVETWANAVDAGAVAEVRILVNNNQVGSTLSSTPGFVTGLNFGPVAVDGAHMATLSIEVQARLASGTGNVQVGCARIEGRQS